MELIERIRRRAGSARGAVRTGIGDDCAVLRGSAGKDWLVTTDLTVEGVHFRRDWHPARAVGHRCLARGLSDIAAMGGEPGAAFLSLALPRSTAQRWVDEFMEGYLALARRTGVTLAGGDIAESKEGIVADTMVVGTVPRAKAILRSGSKPGDQIYVSGRLGAAAAALADFRARKRRKVTRFPHKQDRRRWLNSALRTSEQECNSHTSKTGVCGAPRPIFSLNRGWHWAIGWAGVVSPPA